MSFLNKIMSFMNGKSGMGGEGDQSGGQYTARPRLQAHLIEQIMRTQPLVRMAIEAAPEDIVRAWRVYESADDEWQDIEDEYDLEATMERALIYADAYGGALLVPRYDEGAVSLEQMGLPAFKPRRGSLIGFRVYLPQQLRDYARRTAEVKLQANGLPEIYAIKKNGTATEVPIHSSWTIPVFGAFLTDTLTSGRTSVTCENKFGESKVDMIFDDMTRDIAGLHAISHLLSKSIIDTLSIPGLAEAISNCSDAEKAGALMGATNRALAGVQGASAYQPMLIDKNEELKRQQLSGAQGFSSMSTVLSDRFLAATGVPRTRLVGEQSKGLNNGGESDLKNWYDRVGTVRRRRLKIPLREIDKLIAHDTGKTTPRWKFGNLWELTRTQEADIDKKNAETDQIYMNADVPFIQTAVAYRIQKRYRLTEEQLADIRETDGAD